jgi:hypothetical protein
MGGKDMKTLSVILAIAILVSCFFFNDGAAREAAKPGLRPARADSEDRTPGPVDPGLRGLYEEAAVDTYCIVWYDFEPMYWPGWTKYDCTAQKGTFWHVDDFAGLGGGSHGGLVPLEGTKSFWCGASGESGAMCSWRDAPGYGNGWVQYLESYGFHFTGYVCLSFHLVVDTEPGHDILKLQIGTNWDDFCWCADYVDVASFSGLVDTVVTDTFRLDEVGTQIRFVFTSDSEGSDEDGLYDSDGAAILDNISVSDSIGLLDYEDCESAPVGQRYAGIWIGRPPTPYGEYSGLKANLQDNDPCGDNLATQIVFFIGSLIPASSYPWPGMWVTPFCMGTGGYESPCQNEIVISPVIDMKRYSISCNSTQNGTIPEGELGGLQGALLRFTVYADLPYENLVFYKWAVRPIDDGCPGPWRDRGLLYWHDGAEYLQRTEDVSDLVTSDNIQIALGVVDMCDVWYAGPGSCAEHTPAPWFDNVRLYRYAVTGPQWIYRDMDLFQDNFASTDSIGGFVSADMAQDINAPDDPSIRPGDSIVVRCTSTGGGGIAAGPGGGPAVYMHVRCTSIGYPVKPSLAGSQLEGDYGHYVSDDGTWTIIQADTARIGLAAYPDYYMFDLNDELFTYGYMIEYYFTADDNAAAHTALPRGADHFTSESPYRGSSYYFEFTCLPTMTSGELYVDDYDGIGSFDGLVQNYFDRTFKDVHISSGPPDRYDVKAPSSLVSNSLASRARPSHLLAAYNLIIWDSGDLSVGTICDGTAGGDKSDDCTLLAAWMDSADGSYPGVWILGDGVAEDLAARSSPQSQALLGTWCGASLKNGSYFDLTGGRVGGVVTPLVTGVSSVFVHTGVPDKFLAFGSCPGLNAFDVLEKTGTGQYALKYPDYGGEPQYAAIQAEHINGAGMPARSMWFGFSWMFMRDEVAAAPMDRNLVYRDVTRGWLMGGLLGPDITDAATPRAYALAQNYPNPFNPSTTIRFDMKEKGLVTVKIYDVAGRLVRTLVSEVKEAGAYSAVWDGRNNLGAHVASGIYFYKMEAKGFSATKKLVLLR